MDLAYLVVGISKNVEKDFLELYDRTHAEVYGLSLALVKDRILAREITIETYRRIKKIAGFYDTDMNTEFWILNITKNLCINAIRDKSISKREGKLDNVSKLLKDLFTFGANDRGAIIALKALSNLKFNDIANLLWYYNLSAINEYKRGIKDLKRRNPELRNISEINDAIKKDVLLCLPDIYDQINNEKCTTVSHISHEEINVSSNVFLEEDSENEYVKRLVDYGKNTKSIRYISIISISILVLALLLVVPLLIVKNHKKAINDNKYYVGNDIGIVEIGDYVYYQNYKDKSKLYSYNLKTSIKSKLCNDFAKELNTDGTYLYYRNKNDSRIYRINLDGTDRLQLTKNAGASLFLYEEYVYYSSSDGINRMKKDGSSNEVVIDLSEHDIFRYNIVVYNDIIYFSGGAGMGIYYIDSTKETKDINALFFDEAYDMQIADGNIYFSTKTAPSKKQSFIYQYNLEKGQYSAISDIISDSGAFYIRNGEIYMDGYTKNETGTKKDEGVYKLLPNSNQSSFIVGMHSTDIYVSDNYIYSYSPDNGGSLAAYDKNDISRQIVIF